MNKITIFKTIEDMNEEDVRFVLDKTEAERIAYFKYLNIQWKRGDSEATAFREYHRWLSLLDDKFIDLY